MPDQLLLQTLFINGCLLTLIIFVRSELKLRLFLIPQLAQYRLLSLNLLL